MCGAAVLIVGLSACGERLEDVANGAEGESASRRDSPTFGTMPDPSSGREPPDYVSVWNQEGTEIAGYVHTQEFLNPPDASSPEDAQDYETPIYEVYDTDLSVVGYWVSEVGFVTRLSPEQHTLVLD